MVALAVAWGGAAGAGASAGVSSTTAISGSGACAVSGRPTNNSPLIQGFQLGLRQRRDFVLRKLALRLIGRDHARALDMAQRFDTGIVHVNAPTMASEASLPVGGVKDSGWGRSGLYSMEDFTEITVIFHNKNFLHHWTFRKL